MTISEWEYFDYDGDNILDRARHMAPPTAQEWLLFLDRFAKSIEANCEERREAGYQEGLEEGYKAGYEDSYEAGYGAGYQEGLEDGCEEGRDASN